jgi:hypothetical protein
VTGRSRDQRGQTSLLIIGFFMVAVLLVVVVVDASAAYLRRQRLAALADGAALAATEGLRAETVYAGGLGDRVDLDPAETRRLAEDYLRVLGARSDYPGLTLQVSTSADRVRVEVSTPLDLPLVPPGWEGGTRVTGTSTSHVIVVD